MAVHGVDTMRRFHESGPGELETWVDLAAITMVRFAEVGTGLYMYGQWVFVQWDEAAEVVLATIAGAKIMASGVFGSPVVEKVTTVPLSVETREVLLDEIATLLRKHGVS